MTLKTKLLLGFLIMLLLTALTAFTGWRSLEDIGYQARVVNRVEDSLTTLLLAQVKQLEFLRLEDDKLAAETEAQMEASLKSITEAHDIMLKPENRAMAQQGMDFLQWYRPAFSNLVENEKAMRRSDTALVNTTTGIGQNMDKLTDSIEKAIRGGNTSALAMDSYRAVVNAHQAFIMARLRSRAFTASPSESAAKLAEEQIQHARESMDSAAQTLRLPENIALAKELQAELAEYSTLFQSLRAISLKSDAIVHEVDSKVTEHVDSMRKLSAMTTNTIISVKDAGNVQAFVVAGVSLLLGLGIAFFLAHNVQRQLGKDPSVLVGLAQRVTDGDYNIDDGSPHVGVYGNLVDMVGSLKEHMENAHQESKRAQEESERAGVALRQAEEASREAESKAKTILTAADKLEEVAVALSSASNQLSAQIAQSEHGASEQAARIAETATAMEEMNSTVLEVARNAGQASEVSAATRRKAEDGSTVVQQAVDSIQQVQAQSLRLKADMAALGESAQSISQIMSVISDIADQTNLLALNAAIEAARAGDAGRGFAVVADEVRKLAEKTMQSTTDVGNAIKAIQESTTKSMEQVDAAVHTIEEATQMSTQSGGALAEIVSMVDSTADQVRAIATAAEQQSASSEEINQSITQVSSIASETSRAMEEASQAVSSLAEQAHTLSKLIEDMKRG